MTALLLIQLIVMTSYMAVRGLRSEEGLRVDLTTDKLKHVADNINKFAFNLRKTIDTTYNMNDNYVFSPLTLFSVLGSYGIGSKGKTSNELSRALHFDSLKSSLGSLSHFFNTLNNINGSELNLKNKMMIPKGINISKKYIEQLKTAFHMQFLESNSKEIKSTEGNVPGVNMRAKTSLSASSKSERYTTGEILVESSMGSEYQFKWGFPRKDTTPRVFRFLNGTSIKVNVMTIMKSFPRYLDQNLHVDVLAMPLAKRQGHMIFANSKKYKWSDVSRRIDSDTFTKWMTGLKTTKLSPKLVAVYIPRFKMAHQLRDVNEILNKLGVQQLFSSHANLSAINDEKNIYCSTPILTTYFEIVDDEDLKVISDGTLTHDKFVLDSPFMFWVVDAAYHTVLLSGRIMDPSALEVETIGEEICDEVTQECWAGLKNNKRMSCCSMQHVSVISVSLCVIISSISFVQ